MLSLETDVYWHFPLLGSRMVSINRSFLYGICFASITWIISLCLYIKLTSNESQVTLRPSKLYSKGVHPSNSIIDPDIKPLRSYKLRRNYTRYVTHSSKLIKKLQPTYKSYSNSLSNISGKFIEEK